MRHEKFAFTFSTMSQHRRLREPLLFLTSPQPRFLPAPPRNCSKCLSATRTCDGVEIQRIEPSELASIPAHHLAHGRALIDVKLAQLLRVGPAARQIVGKTNLVTLTATGRSSTEPSPAG